MSCFKCGKKTDRSVEQIDISIVRRCCRCVSICINVDCKKKIFKNGRCSLHTVIVNPKNKIFKGKVVTDADLERRERLRLIEEDYKNGLIQKQMLIEYHRQKICTNHCNNGRETLRKLEESLKSTINEHDSRLDSEVNLVKELMLTKFNKNMELMFANGEYLPGYKTEYQEYKGKYKEYKSHFDNYRKRKYAQEKRKAERTKKRSQERAKRETRREDDNEYYQKYSCDDSDEEPDIEDEETYFIRTSGYVYLSQSFAILDLEIIKDYDEIRRAYKKMCLKVHPDKHPGKEDFYKNKFFEVTSAYELIMAKMFPNLPL